MTDDDYEAIPNSSLVTNLMAGALAGITEHSIMYPIDSIKVKSRIPAFPVLYNSSLVFLSPFLMVIGFI